MPGNQLIVGTLKALLGADTAEYVEGLKKSADATEKFQSQLTQAGKSFQDAGIRMSGLKSLILDFSGTLDVRKAEEYAEAVKQIGGASKLTEQDQARVNKVMVDALNHYRALGQEAPAHMVALEQSTRKVEDAAKGAGAVTGALKDQFAKLTAAFTASALIERGVSKLIEFGKQAFEAGGEIADMSARLGISTDAVQQFGFAAAQTGSSVEDVGKAIQTMSKAISTGGDATAKTLKDIGLSLDDIKKLEPEAAFKVIAERIQQLPNPMDQTRVAMELFGKSGAQLLPAIKQGFLDIADAAPIMSQATIEALDAAGDEWDKFLLEMKVTIGEAMGEYFKFRDTIKNSPIPIVLQYLEHPFRTAEGAGQKIEPPKLPAPPPGVFPALPAIPKTADILKDADVAKLFKDTDEQLRKAKQAADAFDQSVLQLQRHLTGADLADEIKQINAAVVGLQKAGKQIPAAQFDAFGKQLDELLAKGAKLTPALEELHAQWLLQHPTIGRVTADVAKLANTYGNDLAPKLKQAADAQDALNDKTDYMRSLVGKSPVPLGGPNAVTSLAPPPGTLAKALQGDLHTAADSFGGMLAQAIISGQSVTEAVRGLSVSLAGNLGKTFGESFGKVGSTLSKSLGGILGPAFAVGADLLGKAFGKIFGSKGRQAVEEFAKSQGGFDALQAKLATLGAEGDRLWRNLTQGVGRNDPKAAQKAIDDVTAAFDRQEQQLREVEQAQAAYNAEQDALAGQLATFQTAAPAALQPFVQQLLQADNLTDSMRSQLERLAGGDQWQTLQQNAEKFGIPIDALGQKFQQLKGNATFDEINSALTSFRDNGADMNEVLKGMSDEVNAVVKNALKFGTDVPEYMQPWLQAMADSGQLLDENGDKMSDLSRIKFTPIESSFDKMAKVLEQIRDLLAKGLPDAADKAAKDIDRTIGNTRPTVRVQFQYENQPGAPDIDAPDTPQLKRGGVADWGAGTLAVLHGREAVIPLDGLSQSAANISAPSAYDLGAFAGALGGPPIGWAGDDGQTVIHTVIQIDGRTIAETVTPQIARLAQRRGYTKG